MFGLYLVFYLIYLYPKNRKMFQSIFFLLLCDLTKTNRYRRHPVFKISMDEYSPESTTKYQPIETTNFVPPTAKCSCYSTLFGLIQYTIAQVTSPWMMSLTNIYKANLGYLYLLCDFLDYCFFHWIVIHKWIQLNKFENLLGIIENSCYIWKLLHSPIENSCMRINL